ncbi:MAG TPA: peptidoglycan-binding domain-containing protein [Casimicrobiaceae bacterium]|nr:peptidoglycan-binding domain-containing protein [Casimicrobiaceae bacterium]
MTLRKLAVALAALSLTGVAAAAGNTNTTTGATNAPNSTEQPSSMSKSPQSAISPSSSSSQMSNSSSSQGAMSGENNPETVRSAQQALNEKGFNVGTVDGQMGPNTEAAIKKFQQSKGLPESGNLDEQTLAALGVEQNQTSSQGNQGASSASNSGSMSSQGSMQHKGATTSSNTYK